MKTHITKALALVMTVLMLVGYVPSSALPVLASTDSDSTSIFDSWTIGKGNVTNTETYNAEATLSNTEVSQSYSPYEPYSTMDENHSFLPSGSAWINLKNIPYGAPATPTHPMLAWSANTSVYNTTNNGAFPDMDLIDKTLWAAYSQQVTDDASKTAPEYIVTENGIITSADVTVKTLKFYFSADATQGFYDYETGEKIDDLVWTDSNTDNSVDRGEVYYQGNSYVAPDNWEYLADVKGPGTHSYEATFDRRYTVSQKNGNTARVYNRYDAMQGKWGLTLDRYAASVDFTPVNTDLFLSNTPYFYFSTETAPATEKAEATKMAVSLLIGTPVVEEQEVLAVSKYDNNDGTFKSYEALKARLTEYFGSEDAIEIYTKNGLGYEKIAGGINDAGIIGGTSYSVEFVAKYKTNADGSDYVYEYKWYTVTDNQAHPGVAADSVKNTMNPSVTVSSAAFATVADAVAAGPALGNLSADTPDTTGWTDGSVTGCIDFTTVLDLLYADNHKGVMYDVARVRVDVDGDTAARVNYMYFAPALDTVFTPQVDNGVATVNPATWGNERPDADGWENGQAVTITNNAEKGQVITIDTTSGNTALQSNPLNVDNKILYEFENHMRNVVGYGCTKNHQTMSLHDLYKHCTVPEWDAEGNLTDGCHTLDWLAAHPGANCTTNYGDETVYAEHTYRAPDSTDTRYYSFTWKNIRGPEASNITNPNEALDIPYQQYEAMALIKHVSDAIDDSTGLQDDDNSSDCFGDAATAKSTVNACADWVCVFLQTYRGGNTVDEDGDYIYQNESRVGYTDANSYLANYQNDAKMYAQVQAYITHLRACKSAGCSLNHNWMTANDTVNHGITCHADTCAALTTEGEHSYTHFLDNKHYVYENDSDNIEYVTITIPVRKWIHTLSDDRKFSMKINVETTSAHNINPTISLWGNKEGSVGSGLSRIVTDTQDFGNRRNNGIRTNNEMIIAILGNGIYLSEQQYYFPSDTVDRTMGNSTTYKGEESWYDLLRSPYTFDRTITSNDTDETSVYYNKLGYTYVENMRICVEKGTKLTITAPQTSGNSAGLNMYDAKGGIVNAYDGGFGANPVVNTDDTSEKTNNVVTIAHDTKAAAYGPYIPFSDYTSTSLMDSSETAIKGTAYRMSSTVMNDNTLAKYRYIYELPDFDTDKIMGRIYTSGSTDFIVYATIKIGTGSSYTKWGAVGVLTIDGVSDIGWVCLADKTSSGFTHNNGYTAYESETGEVYDFGLMTFEEFNTTWCIGWKYENGMFNNMSDAHYDGNNPGNESLRDDEYYLYLWKQKLWEETNNEWVYSNFGENSDFAYKIGDSESEENWTTSDTEQMWYSSYYYDNRNSYPENVNILMQMLDDDGHILKDDDGLYVWHYSTALSYANMWRSEEGTSLWANTNSYGTELTYPMYQDSEGNWHRRQFISELKATPSDNKYAMAITRTLDTGILMRKGNTSNTYPVLHYDLGTDAATMSVAFVLAFWNDDTNDYSTLRLYHLDTATNTLKESYYTDGGVKFNSNDNPASPVADSFGDDMNKNDTVYDACKFTGDKRGYISFEKFLENKEKIKLVSVSIRLEDIDGGDPTTAIRRLEILQEEEAYLDEINVTKNAGNGYTLNNPGGEDSRTTSVHMYEAFNVINDAYYYNHNYDVQSNTVTISTHGQKGWTGRVIIGNTAYDSYDEANPHPSSDNNYKLQEQNVVKYLNQPLENGYLGMTGEVENVYQYKTSLGHMRIWLPGTGKEDGTASTTGQFILQTDRSYNVDEYRYLYYSYSMRDVDTKIAAENDTSGNNGVELVVKTGVGNDTPAYIENGETWSYETTYNSSNVVHTYNISANGAIDLKKLAGKGESISQIIFYLKNSFHDQAEFYINYIYLSNTPINSVKSDAGVVDNTMKNLFETTEYEYYYMMDNTGGRYSARFPTLDNPTGAVNGSNCDNSRVNPIKVERGAVLSTGTYLNGDPLGGYGDGSKDTDTTNGTEGYYGNTTNTAGIDPLESIWFYTTTGTTSDNTADIRDYYNYVDRERLNMDASGNLVTTPADKSPDIYDMLWSYGHWFTGTGNDGLNIMYVAQETNEEKGDVKDEVSGALTRRYATENYVLLRAGITPRTYTTYYDANGGEFLYDGSPDYIKDLEQVTENNYYITDNTILEYFDHPGSAEAMLGDVGEKEDKFLKKPGYTFSHWEHYNNYTEVDSDFNYVNGSATATNPDGTANGARFVTFIKKNNVGVNYFRAVWIKDEKHTDAEDMPNVSYVEATFLDTDNKTTWRTVKDIEDEVIEKAAGSNGIDRAWRYVLTMPSETIFVNNKGVRTHVYGWQVLDTATGEGTGNVFSPGEKIYLTENKTFVPVTEASAGNTFTVTLHDAKLYVRTSETDVDRVHHMDQYCTKYTEENGVYTYSGVPENYSLVVKPINETDGYGWTEIATNVNASEKDYVVPNNLTLLSDNQEEYRFTAHRDVTISYDNLAAKITNFKSDDNFYSEQDHNYVTTSHNTIKREDTNTAVYFTSQFRVRDDFEVLAAGTMITKNTYYDTYKGTNADGSEFDDRDKTMRLNEDVFARKTVTEDNGEKRLETDEEIRVRINEVITDRTYATMDTKGIKMVQATTFSSNYEFTAYIAHTKSDNIPYYARAYVIYRDANGDVNVAYSDVVAVAVGKPVSST